MEENVQEKVNTASVALRFAEKTDGVNKRVTRALIAMAIVLAVVVVAFCIRDSIVANNYFEHGGMQETSMAFNLKE